MAASLTRTGKLLNLDIPAFAYGKTLPTCEAIAAYVFRRILEDPTLYADCTGAD